MIRTGNYQPIWARGGFGWLFALVGLIVVIVLKVSNAVITPDHILGLFALAFIALLV